MRKDSLQQTAGRTVLPVIAAPMLLVSSPELVIEGCKAGIVGSFPLLNARTTGILNDWMKRITEELGNAHDKNTDPNIAPRAVNLIVHRTNQRYKPDLEMIKKYQPPIVITSLGDPGRVVNIVREYGGTIFSDVSTLYHARRAAKTGVDGLILVCNGAGGHAGTINPFAFIGAVKEFWDGITILSGSISTGQDVFAVEALGADFAYMGTRFIATSESLAGEDYQNMLIDSSLEDLIYTDAFSGVNANYLIPSIQKAGIEPNHLVKKESADFSEMNHSEAKARKDIWSAGQGVGTIKRTLSVAETVEELWREYDKARTGLLTKYPTCPN